MKKFGLLLVMISLVLTTVSGQSSRFAAEKYTNGKGDTLKYRLLTPDYALRQKYPLVIFLHGSGERGNNAT